MNIQDYIHLNALKNDSFDAVQFSLMGMSIVFGGLIIIALYIFLLPKLLNLASSIKKKKLVKKHKQDNTNELEILLAITCAYHLHKNFPEGNEKITWKSHGDLESPWQVSGRMHSLGVRKRNNSWNKR